MFSDEASRNLFDYGLRELERRFDAQAGLVRVDGNDSLHDLRDSLWYALCLLLAGNSPNSAGLIIRRVLGAQVADADDPHCGNFRWFYEDEAVFDLNAVEFAIERLVHILLRVADRLYRRHVINLWSGNPLLRSIVSCLNFALPINQGRMVFPQNGTLVLRVHQGRRNQEIRGRSVAGNGDVVNNSDAKQGLHVHIMGVGFKRVPKEDDKVYLPLRDTCSHLQVASQRAALKSDDLKVKFSG